MVATTIPPMPPTVNILDVRVHAVSVADTVALLDVFIQERTPRQVITCNPEFIMLAQKDAGFLEIINRAALVLPDGVGLLWAARQLHHRLPERVTGVDTVERLAALSQQKGYRLFFLGAAPGVAEQAVANLRRKYPRLHEVGCYSGSPAPEEEDKIAALIAEAQPDVLFVAFGAPAQDKWIARNQPRLNIPLAIGVGGAFDFHAGIVPRAPLWLQRLSLEWLYRLLSQPWRYRRMLALPRFVWAVWRQKQIA
jgi:N-acetylglucosaminyldiphosphoundecaprenol N-acetyl-beta-D-mannosaminyltransferase